MIQHGSWRAEARRIIADVARVLPEDMPLTDRMKAIDAAYPFGLRKYHPYKMWLIERGLYLSRYGYAPKSKKLAESPLERMMRRAELARGG